VTPIGTPKGAPGVLFSSVRRSGRISQLEEDGELVTLGFGLEAGSIRWENKAFFGKEPKTRGESQGEVTWVYKVDGSGSVWAVFGEGKVLSSDAVKAELVADYVQ